MRRAARAALTVVALVGGLLPLMSGVAEAAPPVGSFLNPSSLANGPGNVISDKADGTDGTYHVVVRTTDPDAGGSIVSVVIQVEDGDADAAFETIGTATRVGTTDTWQLAWDVSAHTPAGDVDADPGVLRALVTDSAAEVSNIDQVVVFNDATAETVEITGPTNGGPLGFFNNGATTTGSVTGTASSGATAVDLFYTIAATGTPPVWVACGTTAAVGTGTKTFAGLCAIGAVVPSTITGIAAIPVGGVAQSGDAHRLIGGFVQSLTTWTIVPPSDSQSIGFCNTYTVQARDQVGGAITNAQVDVRAVGTTANDTQDNLQFAINSAPGDVTDPFTPANTGFTGPEATAGCDQLGPENDGANDDSDTDSAGPGQGEIDNPGGPDTKGIEGFTQANGNFRFSLDAEQAGGVNISAFDDRDDDDFNDPGEFAATATKTFQTVANTTLTATPADATNVLGETHTVTATLIDQNGNPVPAVALQFKVTAGPHVGLDLDANPATPPGVFGPCTTAINGQCADSYVGTVAGTDTISVFTDTNNNFVADGSELATTVSKLWVATNAATCIDLEPETDTNPTTATHVITAYVTNGTYDASGDDDKNDDGTADENDCNGTPLSGIPVDFVISDDTPNASLVPNATGTANDERVFTNATGVATVTLDNVVAPASDPTAEGQNTVTATVPGGATASSYSLNEIPLNFENIQPSGAILGTVSACDDCVQDVTIPFPFSYYNTADTAIEVSSNGYLNFDDASNISDFTPDPIPSTNAPNGGLIAGLWTDLDPGNDGDIYVQTLGVAPNRRYIVQWDNVEHFSGTSANLATFQIKLFETTNRIEVHYFAAEASSSGNPITAGIENQAGTVGTPFLQQSTAALLANRAVLYTPGQISVSKTWERAGIAENIDCTPEDDRNIVGATHAVNCTVTDFFGTPVAGANVDFQVVFGPHADNDLDSNPATPVGYFGEGTTSATGTITSFAYTGVDILPNNGNDVINAFIDENDNDLDDNDATDINDANNNGVVDAEDQVNAGDASDFVDKSWTTTVLLAGANVELDMVPAGTGTDDTFPGTANTKKCDADLGSGFPLPPGGAGPTFQSSHTGMVNTIELVCASAKDANGNILIGSTVTLTGTGVGTVTDANGPPPGAASQSNVIDADGYAEFYIFSTATGVQTVTATIAGVTDTDAGTKTYTPGPARRVVLAHIGPSTNPPGTSHQLRATVVDRYDNPIPGYTGLSFTETGPGRFQDGPSTDPSTIPAVPGTIVTNALGQVVVEVFTASSEAGTQTITANLPVTGGVDDCELPVGQGQWPPVSTDPNASVAGQCASSVQKIWTVGGARYNPLTPARILDTRDGNGVPAAGKIGPAGTVELQVTGRGGIPATGVTAVVMNVTTIEPTLPSFLTAWPAGISRPLAANLNYPFRAGEITENLVTVKVGTGGKVMLYNHGGTVHIGADVAGWYGDPADTTGSLFNPLSPVRILDTRNGTGAPTAMVGANATLDLQVTGVAGIPANATAVVLNVTAVNPTAPSFLTAYPTGITRPLAANLNYVAGETVTNRAIVTIGTAGKVTLYNFSGTVDFGADVAGYYGPSAAVTGSRFNAVNPARILDTRNGTGTAGSTSKVGAGPGNTIDFQVTGQGGLPATGVTAVVLNVTVVDPTAPSFLTAWPTGEARPLAADLNYVAGTTTATTVGAVSNLVVVKVGPDGKVSLYNHGGTVHVGADVFGWFTAG